MGVLRRVPGVSGPLALAAAVPERRAEVVGLGVCSLASGTIATCLSTMATCLSAAVAGVLG